MESIARCTAAVQSAVSCSAGHAAPPNAAAVVGARWRARSPAPQALWLAPLARAAQLVNAPGDAGEAEYDVLRSL